MHQTCVNYFHTHLLQVYGCRVQKLCLDGGFTCPNRDGTKARGGCYFCDASGSGAAHIVPTDSITQQLRNQKKRCEQRYGAARFIAYFQAFTNTYASIPRLRSLYDEATADPQVVGLSVGTRADCITPAVCELLAEYVTRGLRVWVEIGVQTINQRTLDQMNRAETVDDYRRAAQLVKQAGLELVAHVIAGLPGDTGEDFLRTIRFLNEIMADGAKIHNLYIDSRATLASWWRDGKCRVLGFEEYVSLVADGLEILSPRCLIHRLSGQAPRQYHLAPAWALDKNLVIHSIEKELERRRSRQGARYPSEVSSESF